MEEGIVLYAPEDERIRILNQTAAVLWELCDGTRDEDALVSGMASRFSAPADVLRRDVQALVDTLRREGLVL